MEHDNQQLLLASTFLALTGVLGGLGGALAALTDLTSVTYVTTPLALVCLFVGSIFLGRHLAARKADAV